MTVRRATRRAPTAPRLAAPPAAAALAERVPDSPGTPGPAAARPGAPVALLARVVAE